MNSYNPFHYISIPFTLLWSILKSGNTRKARKANICLGLIILVGGIWLDIKWNTIPKYVHSVSFERIFTADSLKDNIIELDYSLAISGGASSFYEESDPSQFKEEICFYDLGGFSETQRVSSSSWQVSKTEMTDGFVGIVPKGIDEKLTRECINDGIDYKKFQYGYHVVHKYGKDLGSAKEYEKIDTVRNSFCNSVFLSIVTSDSIIKEPYEDVIYPSLIWRVKGERPDNIFNLYYFTDFTSITSAKREQQSSKGFKFWNKLYYIFSLRDISKSFYTFSFNTSGVDSVNYSISFNEAVRFSEINAIATAKDLRSLDFKAARNDINKFRNVEFMVEHIESTNIQSIRIGFLTALLALPLGLVLKNLWSLISDSTTESGSSTPNHKVHSESSSLLHSDRDRRKNKRNKNKRK